MAREGMLRIVRKLLYPIAQLRLMHTKIMRGLRNRYPAQACNGPGQFFRMSRSAFSLSTSRLSCAISNCSGFI